MGERSLPNPDIPNVRCHVIKSNIRKVTGAIGKPK